MSELPCRQGFPRGTDCCQTQAALRFLLCRADCGRWFCARSCRLNQRGCVIHRQSRRPGLYPHRRRYGNHRSRRGNLRQSRRCQSGPRRTRCRAAAFSAFPAVLRSCHRRQPEAEHSSGPAVCRETPRFSCWIGLRLCLAGRIGMCCWMCSRRSARNCSAGKSRALPAVGRLAGRTVEHRPAGYVPADCWTAAKYSALCPGGG